MNFVKIKHDPNSLETVLRWEEPSETGNIDTHEYTSKDEPHPDFIAALDALKGVVCKACGITPTLKELACMEYDDLELDYENQLSAFVEMTIRGVTLKDSSLDGEAVAGVTITALRKLDWCSAPLVINTPFAPIETLPHPRTWDLIEHLKSEARAFVNGKRKQADLFEEAVTKSHLQRVAKVAKAAAVVNAMGAATA